MEKQWKQWETLLSWAPKSLQMVTAAMKLKDACSLEEKLWQTGSVLKSRDITLLTKVHIIKAMAFPVVMKRWELDHKGDWTPKNWCFWTAVLEKTPESPLHSKNIKPINPKGNQPWICIGRTDAEGKAPLLWPPDVKSQLWKKTLLLGMIEGRKRRGQERMRWLDVITDSMDNEFEQTLGNSEGQESLVCCSPWGSQRVGHDSVTE